MSIRERDAEIKYGCVVSSCAALPERDCSGGVRDAVHACHRHGLWSFTGYDALVTIRESGGTSGSSERAVTVTPYAQVPLAETGILQPNEDGIPRILITLASR